MYCPHDDIAAGGDDAVGDEDCDGDCSTATADAAPTSSISSKLRTPPSKDPLARGKAGSLGKWERLMTSGGAEGGDLGAGGADSGQGPADSPSVGGGGRRWWEESAWREEGGRVEPWRPGGDTGALDKVWFV